jgi:type IV pilus assembly protein PilM
VINIEINSTAIRLMETSGNRVIRWASYSLEPGMFEEEVISDPQALSAAIRRLMASSGIQGGEVIASVSGLYSLSRILTVPTPAGVPITEEAVLAAAGEGSPFSEDMYLSWQAFATGEGGQHVLVVGVPKDVIDGEMRALRAAGINPRILDLKTMALVRAVNREQALILNIEPASFDIVLVVNGVAESIRTTAWRQEDFSSEEGAEHLASALEMTVGFYDSYHPGAPLDSATPLFITGQMSGDLALTERLQAIVKYPVEPLAPPLEYPAHLPVSQYAVNIGLALNGTTVSKDAEEEGHSLPDINLLPQVYRPWRPSGKQIQFFCAIIVAIALLVPLYRVATEAMSDTAMLQARYDIINSELQRRQIEIKNREPLEKAINEYNTIVDMGGGFTEDLNVVTSLAEQFDISLSSINHQGKIISIVCQSDNFTSFRGYLTALAESGRFSTPIPEPERFPYREGGIVTLEPKH